MRSRTRSYLCLATTPASLGNYVCTTSAPSSKDARIGLCRLLDCQSHPTCLRTCCKSWASRNHATLTPLALRIDGRVEAHRDRNETQTKWVGGAEAMRRGRGGVSGHEPRGLWTRTISRILVKTIVCLAAADR